MARTHGQFQAMRAAVFARVALFGRKINHAEHQLAFIEMLRLITGGKVSPEEAVRACHGILQGRGIKPHRPLEEDLKITDQAMSCDGSATKRSTVEVRNNPLTRTVSGTPNSKPETGTTSDWPKLADGRPDSGKMTSAQRQSYDAARLQRVFG